MQSRELTGCFFLFVDFANRPLLNMAKWQHFQASKQPQVLNNHWHLCWLCTEIRANQVEDAVARLASFLSQIPEIWPWFEIGWPFGLISCWLGLKDSFGFLAFLGLFTLKKFPLKKIITIPFFRQHMRNIFVTNAILDQCPRSIVGKILRDARFEVKFLRNH